MSRSGKFDAGKILSVPSPLLKVSVTRVDFQASRLRRRSSQSGAIGSAMRESFHTPGESLEAKLWESPMVRRVRTEVSRPTAIGQRRAKMLLLECYWSVLMFTFRDIHAFVSEPKIYCLVGLRRLSAIFNSNRSYRCWRLCAISDKLA